jgi:hypothetical protein
MCEFTLFPSAFFCFLKEEVLNSTSMQETVFTGGNVPACVSLESSMQVAMFQPVFHSHLADMT